MYIRRIFLFFRSELTLLFLCHHSSPQILALLIIKTRNLCSLPARFPVCLIWFPFSKSFARSHGATVSRGRAFLRSLISRQFL